MEISQNKNDYISLYELIEWARERTGFCYSDVSADLLNLIKKPIPIFKEFNGLRPRIELDADEILSKNLSIILKGNGYSYTTMAKEKLNLENSSKEMLINRHELEKEMGLVFDDTLTDNNEQENERDFKAVIAENKQLKTRIQELEKALHDMTNEPLIYGHSTPEIVALYAVVKRFWVNVDPDEPDTIANANGIIKWITKTYPHISQNNANAIQRIARPPYAREIGRKVSSKEYS